MRTKTLFAAILLALVTSTITYAPQANAMTNADLLTIIESLQSRLAILEARLSEIAQGATVVATEENFSVVKDESVIYTDRLETELEAQKICESIAFDPSYMWQPIQCYHNDRLIYEDTFVAG